MSGATPGAGNSSRRGSEVSVLQSLIYILIGMEELRQWIKKVYQVLGGGK